MPADLVVLGTIRWRSFDSPMGRMYAAHSDAGLCRLTWRTDGPLDFEEDLRTIFPGRPVDEGGSDRTRIEAELREYFSGQRHDFEVEVDLSMLSEFERGVLDEARQVPYAATVSYSELARRVGRPSAARAVGNALRKNPIPIVVPCHRIVRADGSLGGYGGPTGTYEKRRLLRHESTKAAKGRAS